MKNLMLVSLVVVFLITACKNQNEAHVNKQIVIIGEIQNPKNESLYLADGSGKEWDIEDGTFSAEFESQIPKILMFFGEEHDWLTFVAPGDSIRLSFDTENPEESISFSGDHALENEFLQKYAQAKSDLEGDRYEYYSLAEGDFMDKAKSIEVKLQEKVKKFKKKNPEIDDVFFQIMEAEAYYGYAQVLQYYKNRYERYTGDTTYAESVRMKEEKASIVLENPNLLGSDTYTRYLNSSNWRFAGEIREETEMDGMEPKWFFSEMKAAEERFEGKEIKEYLKYSTLTRLIRFDGPERGEEFANTFMKSTENQLYITELKNAISIWDSLRTGMQAPDFKYPDIDDIVHALSDYNGKYVYVDVWATWCKPCLAEQPALAELEHHYKDNPNIVFMGVSVDEDAEAWKTMVKEKGLGGVQLIANGAWESKIQKDYNINGIPRFILVDKEGLLIDATADRPSVDALKNQLKNLLESTPVIGG
jgi:thiol-disulfide isomerase/thioredoxin